MMTEIKLVVYGGAGGPGQTEFSTPAVSCGPMTRPRAGTIRIT